MRILILKLGAIGDVVMASSLIAAIDEKYPNAEITWICGKTVAQLLEGFNRINSLIVIDEKIFYNGSIIKRISVVIHIWKKLRTKRFDIALNCYRDLRYKLLLLPVRSRIYKDLSDKNRNNSLIPGRYFADEYSRMILENDDYQANNAQFPKFNQPESFRYKDLVKDNSYLKIILFPGGARNILQQNDIRRWPIENYTALAKELIKRKYKIIIVGSETDEWVSKYFIDLDVINLIGKTNIIELIQLLNYTNLLITHDTGILHLAKLTPVKTIALLGPLNPHELIGDKENIEPIWGGINLPCSPCYDGKNFANCDNNICMKNISVNDVLNKITSIIEKTNH
jgi:heptosyltransferase-2